MLKRFIFGFLFGLAILALTIIISGGWFIVYVDIPSFLLMVFLPFAAGFISHGPSAMGSSIKLAISGNGAETDAVALKKARSCLRSLGNYIVASAFLGVFLGIIAILRDVSDLGRVGRNMAICLISVLYASVFHVFFIQPLSARLETMIIEREIA